MSTEQITKFQPDRTLYLRGVDGPGAAASLFNATPTGFSLCGVFRDMADFCVLVIYDADNIFEHYSVRYLPDFDLSGMVLTFDYTSNGLQPLDSVKYSWIDWGILDVALLNGSQQIHLFPLATLKSGIFTPASATVNIQSSGATIYDRLTLFVNNASFDFIASGGETAAVVAANLAYQVNAVHDWTTYADASVSVVATVSGSALTLTNAQTGHVSTSGTMVTWLDGQTFVGLTAGMQICLSGFFYTIQSVDSGTQLTLTSAPTSTTGGGTKVRYTAPRGGIDGNGVTAYVLVRAANVSLGVDKTVLPFSGGVSDGLTWTVSIDFSKELGSRANQVRQAWLTFAPQLPSNSAYQDTEWTVTFANWGATDANGIGTFSIAGPDSSRIGNADPRCVYSTGDWTALSQNNYWHGFAMQTSKLNASVTINYSSAQVHDLYLGTSLMSGRGIVSVSVDGVPLSNSLNCSMNVDSELVTRRLLQNSVSAGTHTVVITLTTDNSTFLFDYLEAAVTTTQIQDSTVTYSNVSPALDFDTDATYKMSPQRLLWHIRKLGFMGHMNEYLGVFWWNQRVRTGETWNSEVITVGGTWQENDTPELTFYPKNTDPLKTGFHIYKTVISTDTVDTIANHFVYYINSSTVAVWAQKTGAGQFTIYTRTPNWGDELELTTHSSTGTLTSNGGNIDVGQVGHWAVDPSASNPLNVAIRNWHSDLFNQIKAAGMLITTSFSMELVYPPADWQAAYFDGTPVQTDTGFANLVSSQCAFIPAMTSFQQSVYVAMATLQSNAGLTPWLQFGEFLWWFFSSVSAGIFTLAGTNGVTIQLGNAKLTQPIPHGMSTGDRVVITGVNGCTSANGTWTITVLDDHTFSIPASPNGAWTNGSGNVRGGSMAYYDASTAAAAQSQLGRSLYKFTCQDDDPTVNGGADAAFLAGQLKAHVDSIRAAVLSQFPDAKFEILYPNDVNNPVCLLGPSVPYSQGGRLNAAVNLPSAWLTQAGSGLDSFKVEALSWSATYLDMDRAHEAIIFAVTPPMSWDESNVAYLVPWFNGTCPWPREFLLASSRGLKIVNFWAYDHLSLMSWPIPLPISSERTSFFG